MEKPLTGWGESGYYSALDQGATSGRFAKEVVTVAHSHNDYLETWVKYGLLGLVSMLGLYASSFILFCRRLRHPNPSIQALALCGSCLAGIFAISGFSQLMLGRNNTLLFFLVSIALLWGMLQRQIKTHDNSIQA
jgi:O-antigen ligase